MNRARIDALLDQLIQLTEEEQLAFVEQFAGAASRAGISAEQAAATLRELGRMVANRPSARHFGSAS